MFWYKWSLVGFMVLTTACPAVAEDKQDGLKEVTAQLASKVKSAAMQSKQNNIRIGLFTGSQDALKLGAGGGSFMSELSLLLGSFVNADAQLELNGQVFLVEDPEQKGLQVIKVKAKLTDKNGDDVAEFKDFTGYVRKATDIAFISGTTVSFKPDKEYEGLPSQGRRNDLKNVTPPTPGTKPKTTAHIENGSLIRSSPNGKYAVEILAGKEAAGPFAPLAATLEDKQFPGLPVVDLEKDTLYRVRVVNHDSVEIAVFLHLDGIDQFTFSENRTKDGRPEFRCWVVDPGKEIVIKGWHKNVGTEQKIGELYSFITTQAGKGAASKFPTLSQGNVGTICVGIAHTKPAGSKGPGLETSVGAPLEVKQTAVTRVIGEPHEFITVRYSR